MTTRRILLALAAAFAIPACGDGGSSGAFQPSVLTGDTIQNIAVADTPGVLLAADLNNDSNLDLVVGGLGGLQIIRGSGAGVMTAAASPAGTSFDPVSSVAVGLVNNDALPDLVVGLSSSVDVEVYLNTGSLTAPYNTFTAYQVSSNGASVGGLALADVDDDGELDVVATIPDQHAVSVILGNGAGAFGAPSSPSPAGLGARAVAAGDFNGDGVPDLVTANEIGDSASLLIATGADPFFELPVLLPAGDQPSCVAAADFNGDSRLDVAVLSYVSSDLFVYRGDGNGSFQPASTTTLSTGHAWLAVGDLSDDDRPDLMIVGLNGINPMFLQGRGNASFIPMDVRDPLGNPVSVTATQRSGVIGDFNDDGLLDFAVAFGTFGSSTVTVRITDTVTP